MARFLAPLIVLTALLCASPGAARIYHWVDSRGVEHFSDRVADVPAAYRDQLGDYQAELDGAAVTRIDAAEGFEPESGEAEPGEDGALPDFTGFGGSEAKQFLDKVRGPMMAFALIATLFVLGIVLAFVTVALLVSCRLVGQETPGFRKAYGIAIVQFLAGLVAGPGVVLVVGEPEAGSLGSVLRMQLVNAAVLLLLNAIVLRALLCDSFPRALGLAFVVNLVLLGLGVVIGLAVVTCAGGAALLGSAG